MRLILRRHFISGAAVLWIVHSWSTTVWFQHDLSIKVGEKEAATAPTPPATTRRGIYSNRYAGTLPRESFSACIMFKDDTHRLIEWLAYHYHVLPLRRAIIGVDQESRTFPTDLADRYSDRASITLWPREFFAPDEVMFATQRKRNMDAANLHLRRQTLFLRKCALQLKAEHRGWTVFIDPDEYLTFNGPANTTMTTSYETTALIPEDLRDIVLPSVREEGIVYRFLQEQRQKKGPTWSHASPCITIPRLLFGSRPSSSVSDPSVPRHRLDTLQYRSHANRRDFKSNRQAKNAMDLQRLSTGQLEATGTVHRLVPGACWSPGLVHEKSVFTIHHYLGSEASFFHRRDDRDSLGRNETYGAFANVNHGTDDTITSWYDGFVKAQGEEVASNLLKGAGEI